MCFPERTARRPPPRVPSLWCRWDTLAIERPCPFSLALGHRDHGRKDALCRGDSRQHGFCQVLLGTPVLGPKPPAVRKLGPAPLGSPHGEAMHRCSCRRHVREEASGWFQRKSAAFASCQPRPQTLQSRDQLTVPSAPFWIPDPQLPHPHPLWGSSSSPPSRPCVVAGARVCRGGGHRAGERRQCLWCPPACSPSSGASSPVLLPSVETADFSGGPFVSAPTEASRLVLFRVRMFLGFFLMPGDGRDEHGGRPSCHSFLLQKTRLLIRIVSLLPRRSTWGLC